MDFQKVYQLEAIQSRPSDGPARCPEAACAGGNAFADAGPAPDQRINGQALSQQRPLRRPATHHQRTNGQALSQLRPLRRPATHHQRINGQALSQQRPLRRPATHHQRINGQALSRQRPLRRPATHHERINGQALSQLRPLRRPATHHQRIMSRPYPNNDPSEDRQPITKEPMARPYPNNDPSEDRQPITKNQWPGLIPTATAPKTGKPWSGVRFVNRPRANRRIHQIPQKRTLLLRFGQKIQALLRLQPRPGGICTARQGSLSRPDGRRGSARQGQRHKCIRHCVNWRSTAPAAALLGAILDRIFLFSPFSPFWTLARNVHDRRRKK